LVIEIGYNRAKWRNIMNLSDYLKRQHLEYCNEIGDIVYESDWIKTVLNPQLPPGDRFSVASFNQWMNDDRSPDGKNIDRLITVFGFGVLPYVSSTKLDPALLKLADRWPDMSQEAKDKIVAIAFKEDNLEPATVTLQT
jgi:hypothetical protein